jgi:hypothetical protein
MTNLEIAEAARNLANQLTDDINNAKDRQEDLRIRRFAIEADRIATALEGANTEI